MNLFSGQYLLSLVFYSSQTNHTDQKLVNLDMRGFTDVIM